MAMLFMVIIASFFLAAILSKGTKRRGKNSSQLTFSEKPPYVKKEVLIHEQEQDLYFRLKEAMPDHYIMAQVRLADIVEIKSSDNWQAWFNKICSKSIDFVLCDKSFSVLACIEYDGKTHQQENRKRADAEKDAALQAAGIPMVRIEAGKIPSVEYFYILLEQAIARSKLTI